VRRQGNKRKEAIGAPPRAFWLRMLDNAAVLRDLKIGEANEAARHKTCDGNFDCCFIVRCGIVREEA
jgi:hypothetical protein